MPADSSCALPAAVRPALDRRRRSERRACALRVTLRTSDGDVSATLRDLSAEGIGFRAETIMALRPGMRFTLVHPQLGEAPCILRWATHPLYGAEFPAGHQPLARVHAVYDGLPPAPGDLT